MAAYFLRDYLMFEWPIYAVQRLPGGRWLIRAIGADCPTPRIVATIDEPTAGEIKDVEVAERPPQSDRGKQVA